MPKTYRSYALTIRPRLGLQPGALDDELMKWFRHQTHAAYVHEMAGEARHLHGQIWLATGTDIDTIRKAIYRILRTHLLPQGEWSPAVQRNQCRGVSIGYNDDFKNTYIQKDGDLEHDSSPEDSSVFYPSLEEQAKAIAGATRVADAYFNRLKNLWLEKSPDYHEWQFTNVDIADFYYDQMFREKTIAVICDSRQRKQKAECLYHYIYPNNDKSMVLTEKAIENYNLIKNHS